MPTQQQPSRRPQVRACQCPHTRCLSAQPATDARIRQRVSAGLGGCLIVLAVQSIGQHACSHVLSLSAHNPPHSLPHYDLLPAESSSVSVTCPEMASDPSYLLSILLCRSGWQAVVFAAQLARGAQRNSQDRNCKAAKAPGGVSGWQADRETY